jgi:hypothetical protein
LPTLNRVRCKNLARKNERSSFSADKSPDRASM